MAVRRKQEQMARAAREIDSDRDRGYIINLYASTSSDCDWRVGVDDR